MKTLTSSCLSALGVKHGFTLRDDNLQFRLVGPDSAGNARYAESLEKVTAEFDNAPLALLRLKNESKTAIINKIDGHLSVLGVDGATTNIACALGLTVADCIPLLVYDTKLGSIGIAHGGWRGLVGGIFSQIIADMRKLGSRPKDIIAVMGPSICANCYEFGDEAVDLFVPEVLKKVAGKWHIDLKAEGKRQLLSAGVSEIEDIALCTYENPDKLYSYRRGQLSGRSLAYIVKK